MDLEKRWQTQCCRRPREAELKRQQQQPGNSSVFDRQMSMLLPCGACPLAAAKLGPPPGPFTLSLLQLISGKESMELPYCLQAASMRWSSLGNQAKGRKVCSNLNSGRYCPIRAANQMITLTQSNKVYAIKNGSFSDLSKDSHSPCCQQRPCWYL